MNTDIIDILNQHFPSIQDSELIDGICKNAQVREIEEGDILMDIGGKIDTVPMIYNGLVKVIREDEQGHELLLYFLGAGETCAMSLTCCMAFKRSEIRAVAQENTSMLVIPVEYLDHWMIYRDWRSFVMNTYRMRFEELLESLDSLAFLNLDERIWNYLVERSRLLNTHQISTSHQEIAADLNSSREVVSRILKQLERKGKLQLGRNKIELISA